MAKSFNIALDGAAGVPVKIAIPVEGATGSELLVRNKGAVTVLVGGQDAQLFEIEASAVASFSLGENEVLYADNSVIATLQCLVTK